MDSLAQTSGSDLGDHMDLQALIVTVAAPMTFGFTSITNTHIGR